METKPKDQYIVDEQELLDAQEMIGAGYEHNTIKLPRGFQSPNYTQVPNDFFDMLPDMEDSEIRATLIVMRETLGYHRDAAKVGMNELATRGGQSYGATVAGCKAAEQRGTFARINPDEKTKAQWRLVIETPSTIEGVSRKHPQPLRVTPSTIEGQVGLNKDKEKKINREVSTPEKQERNPKKKGDLVDGMLAFAGIARERGEDVVENTLQELERGLHRNIPRAGQWQDLARWIAGQGNLQTWLSNYMADQFNQKTAWRLTPEQIRSAWPSFTQTARNEQRQNHPGFVTVED
jgi:hypothetical protein